MVVTHVTYNCTLTTINKQLTLIECQSISFRNELEFIYINSVIRELKINKITLTKLRLHDSN